MVHVSGLLVAEVNRTAWDSVRHYLHTCIPTFLHYYKGFVCTYVNRNHCIYLSWGTS